MMLTSFEPCKFWDMGSLSHGGLVVLPGQEADETI